MIRIIYSWNVTPENLEIFTETWKKTTNRIHVEVKGARGSFMLKDIEDPYVIKTIARWDSLEDWKVFWHENNHGQMHKMHKFGKRVSVEVFEEIEDYTK